MKPISLFFFVAAITGQAGSAVFESDLWPGERPFPERLHVACRVELRKGPSDATEVLQGTAVQTGQSFSFDQTRYVTRQTGAFRAVADTKIHGRNLGQIRYLSRESYYRGGWGYGDIPVVAGALIEYLQYRAEGTCFVRFRGDVIDANMCPLYVPGFELVKEPIVDRWAAVSVGRSTGWLKVDNKCVKVVALRR